MPEDNYDPFAKKLYRPEISAGRLRLAVALFVVMLGATTWLLWHAAQMNLWQNAAGMIGVALGLSLVGWLCEAGAEKGVAKAPVVISA